MVDFIVSLSDEKVGVFWGENVWFLFIEIGVVIYLV